MEQFDREQVRKIWQRVQGEKAGHPAAAASEEPCLGIPEAIVRELSCAAMYTMLVKQLPSQTGSILYRLAREEQQHAATLKGICTLSGGFCPPTKPAPTQKAPVGVLLRRCYSQKLQAVAEYEKRSTDPMHGNIYREMAQQEQAQCRILLQLIGNLSNKSGMHR